MELTNEQTQQIEHYLDKKRFNFIDLKVEILDHIFSDIENLMSKNITFENAYKIIVLKWDKYFRDSSSLYFGLFYSESKIVVKNAVKMFKPFYFLYLTAYFLPVIILMNFSIIFSEKTIDFLNVFLNTILISFLIYMIFIIIKVLKSKDLTKSKEYLSDIIKEKVTDEQLTLLIENIDFERKTELIYSGIQMGFNGSMFTLLQYKYSDDSSSPPNEMIKLIFDDKDKVVGIQPIKLQGKE